MVIYIKLIFPPQAPLLCGQPSPIPLGSLRRLHSHKKSSIGIEGVGGEVSASPNNLGKFNKWIKEKIWMCEFLRTLLCVPLQLIMDVGISVFGHSFDILMTGEYFLLTSVHWLLIDIIDNFNWIQRCLEDVGASVLQERTTKEISKG